MDTIKYNQLTLGFSDIISYPYEVVGLPNAYRHEDIDILYFIGDWFSDVCWTTSGARPYWCHRLVYDEITGDNVWKF